VSRRLPNLNGPLPEVLTLEDCETAMRPRLDYYLSNTGYSGPGWTHRDGVSPGWSRDRCEVVLDYLSAKLPEPKLPRKDEPVWEYHWRLDCGRGKPFRVDWVFFPRGLVLSIIDEKLVSGTRVTTLDTYVQVLDAHLRGLRSSTRGQHGGV
jgi:hypothetical protein